MESHSHWKNFQKAFRAGREAYKVPEPRIIGLLLPITAIVAASASSHYLLAWYEIALVELLLVVIAMVIWLRIRQRSKSHIRDA